MLTAAKIHGTRQVALKPKHGPRCICFYGKPSALAYLAYVYEPHANYNR